MTGGFARAAWSWVDHLRHGGSTPWLDWVARDAGAAADGTLPGDPLPGAAELELVRRLAERAPATLPPAAFERLAEVVLSRSGPGRGLPQLPLLWPANAPARVGAPPVDPATVPEGELVRVGVGALTDLLLASETPPGEPRRVRRRPWTTAFRLAGAPVTAHAVRAWLRAAGHVEGGRHPRVLLFVEPFDVHLAQVWSAWVQRGSAMRWETFVSRWAHRQELPPAARLASEARRWAQEVGPARVHLVVAPRDADAARRTASEVLGLRGRERFAPAPVRDLSPAGTDALRRLNRVLSVRLTPELRPPLLRRAAALFEAPADAPLVVPQGHLEWADQTAARLEHALGSGGYPVHGDLDRIAVRHRVGASHPSDRDVLDLVLRACLALADPARPGKLEAR